jgi:oligopeptide/dipeptide ABC transporter ATP-binding protein
VETPQCPQRHTVTPAIILWPTPSIPHGMNPDSPLLRIRDLSVSYAVRRPSGYGQEHLQAVRGVSLDVHSGRVFGLVGESGCGKSSLARAIIHLVKPDSGSVHYQDIDLSQADAPGLRRARREIQYLFQDALASLSPRRSIWQALLEPLLHYRIGNAAEHRTRIGQVLEQVDLSADILPRYPHELSGGQRQRVALARALIAEPALIIADEPLSSLDASVQARMLALMRKVQIKNGLALLFISHNLAVVQQLATEVGVMYAGEMVERGPVNALLQNPAHPYTRTLLDAVCKPGNGELPALEAGTPPAPLAPLPGCSFQNRCPRVMEHCKIISPHDNFIVSATTNGGKHIARCHLWNS